MDRFQQAAGYASVMQALIYIMAFAFYGGFWAYPYSEGAAAQIHYLVQHQLLITTVSLVMYVGFGLSLALMVVALHRRIGAHSPLMMTASLFGALWVGIIICAGMITTVALQQVVTMGADSPDRALVIWDTLNLVVEGIGGGNEIVGGMWVLLLSLAARPVQALTTPLVYLGIFVGLAGVATCIPYDIFTEIFGLSQIVWFIWLGVRLIRDSRTISV